MLHRARSVCRHVPCICRVKAQEMSFGSHPVHKLVAFVVRNGPSFHTFPCATSPYYTTLTQRRIHRIFCRHSPVKKPSSDYTLLPHTNHQHLYHHNETSPSSLRTSQHPTHFVSTQHYAHPYRQRLSGPVKLTRNGIVLRRTSVKQLLLVITVFSARTSMGRQPSRG